MGGKHHKWTPEDDNYLRRNFDGTQESVRIIASYMGLGFYAVDTRASNLGIKNKGRFSPWSNQDQEHLGGLVGRFSFEVIAERLERSVYSVKGAVYRFGFLARYRDGWYTASEAASILGVHEGWISRRIKEGLLKAKKHGTGPERCNHGPRQWHIEEKDLRQFILDYSSDLVGRNVDLWAILNIVVSEK